MAIVLILWCFLAIFFSSNKHAYLFLRTTDGRTMWVFTAVRPFHVYIICGYDFLLSLRWTTRAHYYFIYIFGKHRRKKTMNYSIIFAVHLQCPTNTSHNRTRTHMKYVPARSGQSNFGNLFLQFRNVLWPSRERACKSEESSKKLVFIYYFSLQIL